MRMLVADRAGIHLELRDHVFSTDLLGPRQSTHNLELTGGFAWTHRRYLETSSEHAVRAMVEAMNGTVDEVIAKSALTTWTVSGDDLNGLAAELAGKPGVDMVAPFGTSLHVSGRDKSALEATIAPYRAKGGWQWQDSEPSLEDVFIDLMTRSKDNFQ